MAWVCAECENENDGSRAECEACDAPRPAAAAAAAAAAGGGGGGRLPGYLVGEVVECEAVPLKDRLRRLLVNVGGAAPLTVVTNASNVAVGLRVVVATAGAALPDGAVVKKTSVGGVASEGVLCDNAMLGWSGGGAGNAALLPDSCAVGTSPPESRPRLK